MDKVRVGIVGSAFSSNIHAKAFQQVPEPVLVGACSSTKARVEEFARKWKIPFAVTDYRRLLERKDLEVIVVGIPNDLDREVV